MPTSWFKKRGYKHFDAPVCHIFAEAIDSSSVTTHVWSPLIHYIKRIKKYKPGEAKTSCKPRPIMYASHRDACILSKYAACLTDALDNYYLSTGLAANVIGYRRLGKSNYHFSAEAYRFALKSSPCIVLCFDITGFFDHLDHKLLKDRLKRVLGVQELPHDWYKVFRHVTKFHYVNRDDLVAHPIFGQRMKSRRPTPLATIAEVKAASIAITANRHKYGIPQGTPISSVFSNLYMIDVDREIATFCDARGAFYRRYSDDILIICSSEHQSAIEKKLREAVAAHKLAIKDEKTERCLFDANSDPKGFQYLGFNISPFGATIRPSSLARQWRKARRNLRTATKNGKAAIVTGRFKTVYTKRLRERLSPIGTRNFSSYVRRSAKAFGSKKLVRSVLRLERMTDHAIRELKSLRFDESTLNGSDLR